ncbi:uncharacterized protein METZ01_LOCUS327892 [marine metagenome]|uniref:Uncharacterized protein n=1 Tax=marine metagenome TaxID=408172 RepID=A0A382PQV9_9ZZZZ
MESYSARNFLNGISIKYKPSRPAENLISFSRLVYKVVNTGHCGPKFVQVKIAPFVSAPRR